MALNENVRTTTEVRGKRLWLKREWLHGLWAWGVYDGDKKLGWVLQQTEGTKWGVVHVSADPYDDIWYEFDTRREALLFGLTAP